MANFFLSNWARLWKGTAPEHAMEPAVASLGLPYRWQNPVFGSHAILDFAWPTLMVALEIDGKEHRTKSGLVKDRDRTERLQAKGWTVLRCTNEDALRDPYGTLKRVCLKSNVTELIAAVERIR